MSPKLGTKPIPMPPFIAQCLLAPGATVAVYPDDRRYMGSVWACRVGGGSGSTLLTASTSSAPYRMTTCGGEANPSDNGDFWLGTVNDGDCTSTTSPITATNGDAIATLRISILLETPLCMEVSSTSVTSPPQLEG